MKDLKVTSNGCKTVKSFLQSKGTQSNNEAALRVLLKDKYPKYTEIEVSFFQLCNLHCSFCWQDSYDPVGINEIPTKADTVIDYLEQTKSQLQPLIQIHMLGGELFEDSNDYYDQYLEFIYKIQDYYEAHLADHEFRFIMVSNMSFKKESTRRKLEAFLDRLEQRGCAFDLGPSWDPTGRPLKGEVESDFHQNLIYFKKYITDITFILTKPTIQRLLKGRIPYFDLLIKEGFALDYDYYMPTSAADRLMPTDKMILEALKSLIKNYSGHIHKLESFTNPPHQPSGMTCASLNKVTILPDGTLTNCRHLDYNQDDFYTPIKLESNANIIESYLDRKECLSCEYFKRCPLSCFLTSDYKKFGENFELDDCMYRILFKEQDALNVKRGESING